MKQKTIVSTGLSRQGAQYANHKQHQLVTCLLWIFGICMLLFALAEPASASTGVGFSLAAVTMGAIVDIDDVSDRDTHGNELAYQVVLIAVNQLKDRFSFPQPDSSRKVKIGKALLKAGQAAHVFEAHAIPTLVSTSEKGDITTTGTNTFVIIMGGDRVELKNFLEEYSGYKFIILFEHIKDSQWHIIGEAERPMVLANTETKNDADGRYSTLTFTRDSVYLDCLVEWETGESIQTLLAGNTTAEEEDGE